MAEDVEKNTNEDNIDNSEAAKLYERLFNSFQEYLKNGGHAYVLDDSGYFDQFGFDAGDRKHAEELNSYANRKAMESVKKAGHQKTQEVIFAEDALLRIKYFEKWDSQRLRDSGVYDQKDDAWKTYRWDNEEQRTKDIEIERQRREAEWQKREAEAEKQRIEAERQRIEMENKEKTKSNNNAAEENSRGQNMNTEEKKTEPKTENMENPKTEVKDFRLVKCFLLGRIVIFRFGISLQQQPKHCIFPAYFQNPEKHIYFLPETLLSEIEFFARLKDFRYRIFRFLP